MRSTLTELLYRRYPRLYAERHLSTRQSVMPFGFEHDDGWFAIVDVLSGLLEPRGVVARQVKEKLGGLRYYYRGGDEEWCPRRGPGCDCPEPQGLPIHRAARAPDGAGKPAHDDRPARASRTVAGLDHRCLEGCNHASPIRRTVPGRLLSAPWRCSATCRQGGRTWSMHC